MIARAQNGIMKRPPRIFDLKTTRIPGELYVPRPSRDETEIARRRANPGLLIYEQQAGGFSIARVILENITELPAKKFALPLLGAALLNTAWHSYAEGERGEDARVQRRALKYPPLFEIGSVESLYEALQRTMGVGEIQAAGLVKAHEIGSTRMDKLRMQFGQTAGQAALMATCVIGLEEGGMPGTILRGQKFAQEQAKLLEDSLEPFARELGSAPSVAQLADQDADLTVHWRRNAPTQAYNAYATAITQV